MLNITSSPGFKFPYLQHMRLIIDIEFKIGGNESIWCIAVMQAIRSGKPASEILSSIKDMATDNYNAVADVLGVSLTDKILKS